MTAMATVYSRERLGACTAQQAVRCQTVFFKGYQGTSGDNTMDGDNAQTKNCFLLVFLACFFACQSALATAAAICGAIFLTFKIKYCC